MMKKLLLVLAVVSISITACNQRESDCEEDSTVRTVFEKKSVYENITRDEWLSLEDSLKRPVYFVMSSSAKYEFWLSKFEELKTLSWSLAELTHINTLGNYIKNNSWMFNSGVDLKNIDDFIDTWEGYGREKFGWNDDLIYFIIGTGSQLSNDMLSDIKNGVNIQDPLETFHYCTCSKESDYCWRTGKKCNNATCTGKNEGCGTLWLKSCNGKCR